MNLLIYFIQLQLQLNGQAYIDQKYYIKMGCGASDMDHQLEKQPYKFEEKQFQHTQTSRTTEQNIKKSQSLTKKSSNDKPSKRPNNSKQKLKKQQIQEAYERAQGDLKKMFQYLQQRISEYYMQLSIDAVQLLTQHKLNQVQTKVFLSEQFLLLAFDILEVIGEKTKFQYSMDVFKIFNKSQGVLISYLKQKYPRAGNIFVPGDLNQVFRQFNMVDMPQNDPIRKSGFCFTDSSTSQIIKKLKLFINALLQQLQTKFPLFQNLLQDRVFLYEVDGKKKSLNYKIGRKLPQNTAKYNLDSGQSFIINSPQVFRMIIKWVTDMQDLLKSPQDQINDKSTFKVYNIQRNQIFQDQITADQNQYLIQDLKSRIIGLKQPFHNQMSILLKQQDIFNLNLIKILNTTQRKQKYVPKNEANVIKYAMYNTKLVSWLMAEKLIKVLKNLIQVGIQIQKTDLGRRVDLIKFNVKDLFRSMVVGNKKQILAVYQNLKKLQQQGRLKILQIRNRLGTPLNDAMIIFTFKESYIICQLQLVLSEGQGVSEKVKSLQVMNHFLYEMVRSPYGVLSEVAVLLGYKDNKINYQQKITFINHKFNNFKQCIKNHPQKIIRQKTQIKPFICTQCTQYFHPLQNIFGYRYCQECCVFQCCRCSFKDNKQLQKNQVHNKFIDYINNQMSQQKVRKTGLSSISKSVTVQDIFGCLFKQKLFLRDIIQKNYQKIKPMDIHVYIKQKKYQEQVKQLCEIYQPYFILVQFREANTFVKVLHWNSNLQQIQNCFNLKQDFYQSEKIAYSYYDFIIFINTDMKHAIKQMKAQQLNTQALKFCLKSDIQILNIKNCKAVRIQTKLKQALAYFIIKIQQSFSSKDQTADKQYEQATKKQFVFASIMQARKSLPNVSIIHENFHMKNYGITTPLLNQYFSSDIRKDKIKIINLNNNKITDISIIFTECINIESITASKNFLKALQIKKPLKNLVKLVLFQNRISLISGLQNLSMLRKLNISNNEVRNLQILNLSFFRQLVASNNSFTNLYWLQKSNLPDLQTLILVSATQYTEDQKIYKFKFPKLKSFKYNQNTTKQLQLKQSPQLRFLDCEYCSLSKLILKSNKLQNININTNNLQNLVDLLVQNCQNLKIWKGPSAGKISVFPKISAQKLQCLDLGCCQITDITNLGMSNLPKLVTMSLQGNSFKIMPELNLPSLTSLDFYYVNIQDISPFGRMHLPLLKQIAISGQSQRELQQCPKIKFQSLQKLTISSFKFKTMKAFSQSLLPKIQYIYLYQVRSKDIPKFQFESLQQLNLYDCTFEDYSNFNESRLNKLQKLKLQNLNSSLQQQIPKQFHVKSINFPSLKQFHCQYLKVIVTQNLFNFLVSLEKIYFFSCNFTQLPLLNLPKLQRIQIIQCQLKNLNNLSNSSLPKLEHIDFSANKIEIFPKVNLPSLKTLYIWDNQITQFNNINSSNLSSLQQFNFDRNKISQFSAFKLPKLKKLNLSSDSLKTLKGLHNDNLVELQQLNIESCLELKQKTLPTLKFQNLKILSISSCSFQNLDQLSKSLLPSLQILKILFIPMSTLPIIKFPKLLQFSFTSDSTSAQQGQPEKPILNDIRNLSKWECPNLQKISFTSTKIKQIPLVSFPKLKQLQISSSTLQNTEQLLRSQIPKLQTVIFRDNPNLTKIGIPKDCSLTSIVFQRCNLQELQDLSKFKSVIFTFVQCKIKKISKIKMSDVQTLNLYDNQISDIRTTITQAPKLISLNLQRNQIEVFPDLYYPCLVDLDVSNNKIRTISFKKKNFPVLRTINLQQNQLQKIEQIQLQQSLYSFIAGKNKLKQINFFKRSTSKTAYQELNQIYLQYNQIQKIQFLPKCYYLILNNNKIKDLNWISSGDVSKWQTLTLTDNQISDVSGLFNKDLTYDGLFYLYLGSNKIKNFVPSTKVKFPNLYLLDLSVNKIQVIDKMTAECFPQLNDLNLQNNNLKKVGPNLQLNGLIGLNLSQNKQLQKLDGLVGKNLNSLAINDCNVKSIQWLTQLNCINLSSLQIKNNHIKKIPKILKPFPKLGTLSIQGNQLQNVDQFLLQLEKIRQAQPQRIFGLVYNLKKQLPEQWKNSVQQKIKILTNQYSSCLNEQLQPKVQETKNQNQIKNQNQQVDNANANQAI